MSPGQLERSLVIPADPGTVWQVVGDLDGYHRHADGLAETAVVAGDGPGARRRCVDTSGGSWEETCTVWEPGRRYVIDVDVSTYPMKYRSLFSSFRGTWSLRPVPNGTEVTIRFDAEFRRIPGVAAVVSKLWKRSERDIDRILASYRDAVMAMT